MFVKYIIVKKSTLKGLVDRYKNNKNVSRKIRKPISYKVRKEQVKTALKLVDNNEQLTMDELLFCANLNVQGCKILLNFRKNYLNTTLL